MHQNLFSPSNPIRSSETTASTKPEFLIQNSNRPFFISRRRESSHQNREVSSTAHWNNQQKESYCIFICYFRQILSNQRFDSNNWNIFKGMSKFINTRNAQQCRSHHLKLLKEFNDVKDFISIVIKRVSHIKQKIIEAEEKLIQIQNQFNLFMSSVKMQKSEQQQIKKISLINSSDSNLVNSDTIEKIQKQDFIKTSDSYIGQQNPVNLNNNNLNFFSSRSQFKPFSSIKIKSNRSSLPSFEDVQEPVIQNKQNFPLYDSSFGFSPFENQLYHQQPIKNEQKQTKYVKQRQSCMQKQPHKMQTLKQFMQCHYLYQLWTSKLQKLIRQSSVQNEKLYKQI